MPPEALTVIACGALAREITRLIAFSKLHWVTLACLPATLHNRPERIPEAVRGAIHRARERGASRIVVAYADCGTGGLLDQVLAEEGVVRLEGAHCYAAYAGQEAFAALAEAEPGTFYLTDFLARQFDTLVVEGLGLDRHPELRDAYFGNYTRLVLLAQSDDAALTAKAEAAARRLGLAFERVFTGMGELATFVQAAANGTIHGATDHSLLARHPGPGDRQGGPPDGQASARGALRAGDRPGSDAGEAHRDGSLSRAVAEI
jgi:hypothetical protein